MRPRFCALATAVLVAGCGGKIADDTSTVLVPGPTATAVRPLPPAPSPHPVVDASAPPPNDRLSDGYGFVAARSSDDPKGLDVEEDVYARFDPFGHVVAYDPFDAFPADATAGGRQWLAWGSPILDGARVFYAIGKQVPRGLDAVGVGEAQFEPIGLVADAVVQHIDLSAFCSLDAKLCKIVINLHRTPSRSVQFAPAATIDGTRIQGDALAGKSKLRGAFTCAKDCPNGTTDTFGMVLAYAIEDEETGVLLRGAAALAYRSP